MRGIQRLHLFVTEPQPLHDTWPEVLNQHIGIGQQFHRNRVAFLGSDIQHDGLFVAIHHGECAGHPISRWAPAAHQIAFRRLDLHHVRSLIAQNRCCDGARVDAREIDDSDTGQWSRCLLPQAPRSCSSPDLRKNTDHADPWRRRGPALCSPYSNLPSHCLQFHARRQCTRQGAPPRLFLERRRAILRLPPAKTGSEQIRNREY